MKITPQLIQQVKTVKNLELQFKEAKERLEIHKKALKKKFKYGVFKVGKYQVTKTYVESCIIPEHSRDPYDLFTIK